MLGLTRWKTGKEKKNIESETGSGKGAGGKTQNIFFSFVWSSARSHQVHASKVNFLIFPRFRNVHHLIALSIFLLFSVICRFKFPPSPILTYPRAFASFLKVNPKWVSSVVSSGVVPMFRQQPACHHRLECYLPVLMSKTVKTVYNEEKEKKKLCKRAWQLILNGNSKKIWLSWCTHQLLDIIFESWRHGRFHYSL